ncbi:MAG: TolC family protein [Sulfuriferula multivorans]|uniref:TolC family protein n=1 Tax=Sulfuriferula multivorans TaxID=1559896 RepID=A0A7C9NZ28_9PROT|nr:TolC family protein [Sulfuriferula multivorans]
MMIRLLMMGFLTVSGAAQAMQPVTPAGLLPTEIARPLLEQDPAVAAAREGLEVARQEARILEQSPHEWGVRTWTQQRRVQNGSRYNAYNEWSVGVERAIRLPGKAEADRRLGQTTVEESKARYGEALHESARELMALWVEWLAAERAHELTQGSLQSTQASLGAVEKRIRAGDASKLDLSIARADLAEQRRMDNDAKTQAAAAWARLSTRFPGVKRQAMALPMPSEITTDAAAWRERILEQSDEFKVAKLQMQKTQAYADRARADKIPDPTLGGYTTSELGGRERIFGVMVSVPIPGGARNSHSAKAVAAVEVSRREVELKQRELETAIASAIATAQGAYASLQIANEGASFMQENAALMQRAYALGEAELQSMLLVRRQATAAVNSALQAQASALRAYYGLLVDAHLIWELDHD